MTQSPTEPTQELRKAVREFREFCFSYRDKLYYSGEAQPTRPLADAQSALEGIIQAEIAAEVTKALDEALTNLPKEQSERWHVSHAVHNGACIPELVAWAKEDAKLEVRKALAAQRAKYKPNEDK